MEASVGGSINLAAIGLKFSFYAVFTFTYLLLSRLDLLVYAVVCGSLLGSTSVVSTTDAKKLVAHLSVLHMSIGLVALVLLSRSTSDLASLV